MVGLATHLNAVQRLELAEEVVGLAATAIQLRHPRADVLATFSLTMLGRYSDAALADAMLRLKAWLAEQEEATPGPIATAGG